MVRDPSAMAGFLGSAGCGSLNLVVRAFDIAGWGLGCPGQLLGSRRRRVEVCMLSCC